MRGWHVGIGTTLVLLGFAVGCPVDDDDTAGDDDVVEEPVLCINEFMASNTETIDDGSLTYPDWVELYNLTDEDLDLGGFFITDDLGQVDKHRLDDGLILPASGFLLLWADDNEDAGPEHLSFQLDQTGEALGVYGRLGDPQDSIEWTYMLTDWAWARFPDGEVWDATHFPTPGTTNQEP